MVRATLEGAVRIRHDGTLHVWLLDEGDDEQAKALCARTGRAPLHPQGRARLEPLRGVHKARTKHGNYSAWLARHGGDYDYFASVDTDHVPLPNFLERMLGYFRDPDVAFVVRAPGVRQLHLGRHQGRRVPAVPLPRPHPARGQPLPRPHVRRHQQRRPRRGRAPGRRAVRLRHRGHGHRVRDAPEEEPEDRAPLAVRLHPGRPRRGEGPASWTDFFTQQLRWSRGTYETLLKQYWKAPFRMPPGRLLNYSLMLVYYPMTAVNWFLGILSCSLYLWLGASGTQVSSSVWMMLYSDAAALQIGLYLWNRRHNVSPHEPEGSGGSRRHGDVGAVRARLPEVPGGRAAAHQRAVRRHPQGPPGQPRPAAHLPHPPRLGRGPRGRPRRLRALRPHPRRDAHLGRPRPARRPRARRRLGLDHRPRAPRRRCGRRPRRDRRPAAAEEPETAALATTTGGN